MALSLETHQLFIIALTHDSQVFALLLRPLQLSLDLGDLGSVNLCIVRSDAIGVDRCHHLNKVFLLNWEAQRACHVTHLDIQGAREQCNLLVLLLLADVHLLQNFLLSIFILQEGCYLLPLGLN